MQTSIFHQYHGTQYSEIIDFDSRKLEDTHYSANLAYEKALFSII